MLEWFRNLVQSIIDWISAAISYIWEWLQALFNHLTDAFNIQGLLEKIQFYSQEIRGSSDIGLIRDIYHSVMDYFPVDFCLWCLSFLLTAFAVILTARFVVRVIRG